MAEAPALSIIDVDLDQKMRESMLDYAMSVITARALPDVRDGLKPVQRRVLYGMYELGLRQNAAFKKSARVVGDVLGKYHPHGDASVYDAIVNLAQDFDMRYPLIDGQGNFGSVDGDSAAAMRYTEIRLTALAEEMLADLEKGTVAFADNFDGSLQEPAVLPAKVPMFLLNGADGIAVGMATKVPPHNLRELCEALILLANSPEATPEDLGALLPGPDFPTGGIIVGREGIDRAYATGQGRVTLRGVAAIENDPRGRQTIAITELPYKVIKAKLIERISELARERKIEGIAAMRDESDRSGMRIAIEIKRDADAGKVLQALYQRTDLEITFGINMLGLVDGGPHQISLKRSLALFIEHRKQVITARTRFDLNEASERLHILEGLHKALDNLDMVVALIRTAATTEAAQKALSEQLDLSPAQARAILDMRLARLATLERKRVADEMRQVAKLVRELQAILDSPRKVLDLLIGDLRDLSARFGDERRTRIIADPESAPLSIEELVPDQTTVVMLGEDGTIKRLDAFGGRGSAREVPIQYLSCNVRDTLLLFTAHGHVHGLPVARIGTVAKRSERGAPVTSLVDLAMDDRVIALLALGATPPAYLVLLTAQGQIKRSQTADYLLARSAPTVALRLDDGDRLVAVEGASEGEQALIHTAGGKAIRFALDEVRPTGRVAGGVRAIRLEQGDRALPGTLVVRGSQVLTLTAGGVGRRLALAEYPLQGRDGGGIRVLKTTAGDPLVVAIGVDERTTLEGLDATGHIVQLDAREAPLQHRQDPGVQIAPSIDRIVPLPRR